MREHLRHCFFVVVCFFLTSGAPEAQVPSWTESELYLSGLKTAATIDELPDLLEVPTPWAESMVALDKTTQDTHNEHGACLNLLAETRTADRGQLTKEYSTLLGKRKTMDPAEYSNEEKRLRSLIEGKGKTSSSGKVWKAGSPQAGGFGSVGIEANGMNCEGESVADVHTHPLGVASPSDGDIRHTIHEKKLHSTFVVLNGKMCGVVKTQATEGADFWSVNGTNAIYGASWSFKTGGSIDYPEPTVVAAVLAEFGLGLYCGDIGKPLKKVRAEPGLLDANNPLYYVLAKGVVISMKYEVSGKPISFPFTPEFDQEFKDYIRQSNLFGGEAIDGILATKTPMETYRKVVDEATLKVSMSVFDGVTIPNFLFFEGEGLVRTTGCSLDGCVVLEEATMGVTRKLLHIIAFNDPKTKRNYVVDLNGGNRTLEEKTPGKVYIKGECSFVEKHCSLNGKGLLRIEGDSEFVGSFQNGDSVGQGTWTDLGNGEVWKVRATPKQYEKIERIK